jgi:hypothetical protein
VPGPSGDPPGGAGSGRVSDPTPGTAPARLLEAPDLPPNAYSAQRPPVMPMSLRVPSGSFQVVSG